MRICYKAGNVTYNTNYYSVITDSVEIRIWFLTDEIIRIRAGFDGDWDEASYSLAMTAWDSRTDEFLKGYRKRVEVAYSDSILMPLVTSQRCRPRMGLNFFLLLLVLLLLCVQ